MLLERMLLERMLFHWDAPISLEFNDAKDEPRKIRQEFLSLLLSCHVLPRGKNQESFSAVAEVVGEPLSWAGQTLDFSTLNFRRYALMVPGS